MRVITGSAKGRKLKELQGRETRPTTDRVKEGLFNIIQFDIEGRRVLDLFAGTGQLGIECLSRGADRCTFVDLRKEAAALIRENLTWCALQERAQVIQGDLPAAGRNSTSSCWTRPMAVDYWKRRWSPLRRLTSCRKMV